MTTVADSVDPSLAAALSRRYRWVSPVVPLAVLLAAAAVLPHVAAASQVRLATEILIMGLFAASLNVLVGYSGLVSLGHAAYFGLGAYTAAVLTLKAGVNMPLALAAAPLAAAAAAAVVGALSVRLTDAYFVMLTVAFGQLFHSVLMKWRALTGGDDGLLGVYPAPALRDASVYYFFTLATVAAVLAVLWLVSRSPFGYSLRALSDSPQRAASSGINLYLHRLLAFEIAAAAAGLAGALWAFYQRSVFPDLAGWLLSADALVMVALGGSGTFGGPLVGAAIFKALDRAIPAYTDYWQSVLGMLILTIAFIAPRGFTGRGPGDAWRRAWAGVRRALRRRSQGGTA